MTAFAGPTVTIAVRSPAVWPFLVILGAIVLGYLFGLSNYGVNDEEAADDDSAAQSAWPTLEDGRA